MANQVDTLLDEEKNVEERIAVAPPMTLMWWKFRKHKAALISGVVLIILYMVAIFCEFVAPYAPEDTFIRYKLSPPSPIHLIDSQGNFRGLFVYKTVRTRDPDDSAEYLH